MRTHLFIILLLTGTSILLAVSCSKSNEIDLSQNGGSTCDTVGMKYSVNVLPILAANCYGCHGQGSTDGSGGISLATYADLKKYADNGFLLGNITHSPGFIGMPYGQPKMDDCNINIILDWVNQGSPNN